MLVKVHSYYSTTFVPGQFTPESWDIPQGSAVKAFDVNVVEPKPIEITNLSGEPFSSFVLTENQETSISKQAFADVAQYRTALTQSNTVDIKNVFSAFDFRTIKNAETTININCFSDNLLSVLETAPTTIDSSTALGANTDVVNLLPVNENSKVIQGLNFISTFIELSENSKKVQSTQGISTSLEVELRTQKASSSNAQATSILTLEVKTQNNPHS